MSQFKLTNFLKTDLPIGSKYFDIQDNGMGRYTFKGSILQHNCFEGNFTKEEFFKHIYDKHEPIRYVIICDKNGKEEIYHRGE